MNIAVIDLETDPFKYGRMIKPFCSGFYDGVKFVSFWSDNCVAEMVQFLRAEKTPYTIYAHNGGKFDYFFFAPHLDPCEIGIINGRIVKARIDKHELRDSYAAIPVRLAAYEKTKIDYSTFTRKKRERHKDEIISYLRDDCIFLYKLVSAFIAEFGDKLTIGSASLSQIKKFHSFSTCRENFDTLIRENFYFGGRVQVFKSGNIKRRIKLFDINSSYPHTMREYLHPLSADYTVGRKVTDKTVFLTLECDNHGAFCRKVDGALDFTCTTGVFQTTVHEYRAAVDTGMATNINVIRTLDFEKLGTFDKFVDHFYAARMRADAANDKALKLFYKLILNSGYGKFAQNPKNYFDYRLTKTGQFPEDWHECDKKCETECRLIWTPKWVHADDYIIWQRPTLEYRYNNIATGASITGAARASLMRGISRATGLIYCDTDSIICEDADLDIDPKRLGAWDLEASGTRIAVAGKKMYAMWDGDKVVKQASKGVALHAGAIEHIAEGGEVLYMRDAPSLRHNGDVRFVARWAKNTAAK